MKVPHAYRVNLAAIALALSKREAPERYPAGTKIDGVNVGGQFIPKDKQDEWKRNGGNTVTESGETDNRELAGLGGAQKQLEEISNFFPSEIIDMPSNEIDRVIAEDIPGGEDRIQNIGEQTDETFGQLQGISAVDPEAEGRPSEGITAFFEDIVPRAKTFGEELSLFANEYLAKANKGDALLLGGLVASSLRLGAVFAVVGETASPFVGTAAMALGKSALGIALGIAGPAWGALSLLMAVEAVIKGIEAMRASELDKSLPDSENIARDERRVREEISEEIRAIKKPNYARYVNRGVVNQKRLDAYYQAALAEYGEDVTVEEIDKNDPQMARLLGVAPQPLYEYEYGGIKYSAPTQEDLIETISYYAPRIDRFPEPLRESTEEISMMGNFGPRLFWDIFPFTSDFIMNMFGRGAGLFDASEIEAYVDMPADGHAVPGNNGRSISFLNSNPSYHENGIDMLAHEMGHTYAAQNFNKLDPEGKYREVAEQSKSAVSNYANTNLAEDFAESVRLYIQNPSRLKKIEPERYEIVRAMFMGE